MKADYTINSYPEGVAISRKGKWILDASVFMRDGEVDINLNTFDYEIDEDTRTMTLRLRPALYEAGDFSSWPHFQEDMDKELRNDQ